MLPDNFDFAQLPDDRKDFSLEEVGMLASRIEDIEYAITSWLKEDLDLPTEEVQRSVDSRKKAAGYSSEKINS